jgi:hypothetical protein
MSAGDATRHSGTKYPICSFSIFRMHHHRDGKTAGNPSLAVSLLCLQRRSEGAQPGTSWPRGLLFKLGDIPLKCRFEFHRKMSIFLAMRVLLNQLQREPRVFKQLYSGPVAHAYSRVITITRNDLSIVHNPSQLCLEGRGLFS